MKRQTANNKNWAARKKRKRPKAVSNNRRVYAGACKQIDSVAEELKSESDTVVPSCDELILTRERILRRAQFLRGSTGEVGLYNFVFFYDLLSTQVEDHRLHHQAE
jgi:hypothetical protein